MKSIQHLSFGDIVDCSFVLSFVYDIHYRQEDFFDGNIEENISKYPKYELKEVFVEELEEPCYYIDDILIEEYKEMDEETMPPIVLDYYIDGTYRTIDGGHRVQVAKEKGMKKIKAFVATKLKKGVG